MDSAHEPNECEDEDCKHPDCEVDWKATAKLQAESTAKLQRFKDYVHKRLDDAGVPVDPESPHKAAGCRIGGRLDWLLARVDELERERDEDTHRLADAHVRAEKAEAENARLREALEEALCELEGSFGGPQDQDENEAALLHLCRAALASPTQPAPAGEHEHHNALAESLCPLCRAASKETP